jgi:hypothetical protein
LAPLRPPKRFALGVEPASIDHTVFGNAPDVVMQSMHVMAARRVRSSPH